MWRSLELSIALTPVSEGEVEEGISVADSGESLLSVVDRVSKSSRERLTIFTE
jgi:hypothetical protein